MRNRENILEFSGLALGEHHLKYKINETFFSSFDLIELQGIHPTTINVILKKANHMMELAISFKGKKDTVCDLTNDPFTLDISNSFSLIVKFGDEFNDEDPEILVLSQGEYEIDLKQLFFELIALSIPIQKIKPGNEIIKDQ